MRLGVRNKKEYAKTRVKNRGLITEMELQGYAVRKTRIRLKQ